MSGLSPPILIKKLVADISSSGIAIAERELEYALQQGFPSLSLKECPPATMNDACGFFSSLDIFSHTDHFSLIYCGTRRPEFGAYLLVKVMFPFDNSSEHNWTLHAHDLPFLRSIISTEGQGQGLIVIGQTRADARSLSVTSGRQSDVFAYLLGSLAGLDNLYAKPGEEGRKPAFPWVQLASSLRSVISKDNIVSISGWGMGRFLRGCFRSLSAVMSRTEFDEQFGCYGVYWRPRSPAQWLRHPL